MLDDNSARTSTEVEPDSPEEARELELAELMGAVTSPDRSVSFGSLGFSLKDEGNHGVIAEGADYWRGERERIRRTVEGIEPDLTDPEMAYAGCEPRFLPCT